MGHWKRLPGSSALAHLSVGALSYEARPGRDLRLDLLRGLAVVAMVVDHLAGASPLYALTGGNRFYTSAAEGFVFLSGLLVGLTYRRIAERDGLAVALRHLLERAWTLYVLAVGLTLVVLPASELLGLPWATGLDLHNAPALVWSVLTLHQTYYLVDVLLLYALLLVVAPLAFILLSTGRTAVLLALSWLLWAGYQVLPGGTELPWPIQDNNLFQLPAWQVLFFTAMALGYHRKRVRGAIPVRLDPWLLAVSAIAVVGLVFAAGVTTQFVDLQDALFAKAELRPGRLLASACVFSSLYLAASRFWVPLRRALGWFLLPLGQHALYAYSVHIVIAVLLAVTSLELHRTADGSPTTNTGIQVASLGVIWLAIRGRVLYPNAHTRRRWMASVVPLAAGLLIVLQVAPAPEAARAAPAQEPVPQSTADRLAQAFGTPIPRSSATARPTASPSPQSVPALLPTPVATGGPVRAIPNVGAIQGTIRERRFYSQALERDMSYYVYLPPGYTTDGRIYPVLYMLHGGGGSKDEWLAYGLVDAIDRLIGAHDVEPMIAILPQGDTGYWVNQPDGPRWGDYVSTDLVRQVDATFRTAALPARRAIGGLSMGGAGALQLAFNHPDVFGIVGAHSPALHLDDGTFALYGSGVDFARREPLDLAATAPGIQTLRIGIDAGEDDPWLDRAELLDRVLTNRGVPHEWRIMDGGHDGQYWQRNVPMYLRFYDAAFDAVTAR